MIAFLGIGGNEPNTLDASKKVAAGLNMNAKIRVLRSSSVYRNKAWGNINQADFYNYVLELDCQLSAQELLAECLNLELSLGRNRSAGDKWGPRLIDIDILLFDNQIIDEQNLTIPHSFLLQRDFFYIPLLELNREIVIPKLGKLHSLVSSQHNMIKMKEGIEV